MMVAALAFADDSMYGFSSVEEVPTESAYPAPSQAGQDVQKPTYPDRKISIAFHPASVVYYEAFLGVVALWLSIETGFGNSFSLITRPFYLSGETFDGVDLRAYGIIEGLRYYTGNTGHQGLYFEPEFQYIVAVGESNTWDGYSASSRRATASGFGLYVLGGYKYQGNHFIMGFDGGPGLNFFSVSSDDEDDSDVESLAASGLGFDINLYLGFAF